MAVAGQVRRRIAWRLREERAASAAPAARAGEPPYSPGPAAAPGPGWIRNSFWCNELYDIGLGRPPPVCSIGGWHDPSACLSIERSAPVNVAQCAGREARCRRPSPRSGPSRRRPIRGAGGRCTHRRRTATMTEIAKTRPDAAPAPAEASRPEARRSWLSKALPWLVYGSTPRPSARR